MGIAFASPVAGGGGDAHKAGVLPILHIANQHAILDQDIAGRRGGAFIVHGDRPAPVRKGAIIHHSHAFRGHLRADKAGEGRTALAVEIPPFQPVTHGLVQ